MILIKRKCSREVLRASQPFFLLNTKIEALVDYEKNISYVNHTQLLIVGIILILCYVLMQYLSFVH